MVPMKYGVWALMAAGMAAGFVSVAKADRNNAPRVQAMLLTHGKYLVTRAAPCADCHSPRDMTGQLVAGRDLQGAPIGFTPVHPIPGWKDFAPSIAGLPRGWSLEQTVHFLETGIMPGGGRAGPPMPEFRFSERDARAIALYLQSLPGPRKAVSR